MGSNQITFYRLALAALMMGLIILFQKKSFRISKQHILPLMGFGALYIFTAIMLLQSYTYIDSGLATSIHFLYPVVVTILMVLFFSEKFSTGIAAAALLSVSGVALLSTGGNQLASTTGILIAFSTSISYAFYILGVNNSKVKELDASVFTFYVLCMGTILLFILNISLEGISPIPSGKGAMNLVLLAFLSTVISNIALLKAVKRIGSTMTSILGSTEPVTALGVGVVVFDEGFGWKSLIGIGLILVAVIIVIRRN